MGREAPSFFPFVLFSPSPPLPFLRLPDTQAILKEVTFYADVLRASSSGGTRDEVLRTSAWVANYPSICGGTANLPLPLSKHFALSEKF